MPSTIFRMSGRKLKLECHLLYSGYQEDNSDDIYTNRYHRAYNSLVIYWLQNIRKRQLKYHLEYQTKDNSFTIFYPEYRTLTRMTPSIFRITRMKFICDLLYSKIKKKLGCYLLCSEYQEDNSNALYHYQNIKKKLECHELYISRRQIECSLFYLKYLKGKLNII